jgi:hypothetical protein
MSEPEVDGTRLLHQRCSEICFYYMSRTLPVFPTVDQKGQQEWDLEPSKRMTEPCGRTARDVSELWCPRLGCGGGITCDRHRE